MTFKAVVEQMKLNGLKAVRESRPDEVMLCVPDECWGSDEPLYMIAFGAGHLEVVEITEEQRKALDWKTCGKLGDPRM